MSAPFLFSCGLGMDTHLNIVSLDVPYPPDYGGVIDIFYKIKALHRIGVHIHLHCFAYGRPRQEALNQYCAEVHYYPRKTGTLSHLSTLPYIVRSRRDEALLANLRANDYSILFEGIHSAYYLLQSAFRNRSVLLRSHNIEHHYYRRLAARETKVLRKLYFYKEAFLLERLLSRISRNTPIAAISSPDTDYLRGRFSSTFWLPPFHSNDEVASLPGRGEYALYHGNLTVSENREAAESLIASFAGKDIPLIVAGKAPPPVLQELADKAPNVTLVANPDHHGMNELMQQAHVILLPTNQATGIKLKLIESLYRGRFCVANTAMIAGTKLEQLVTVEKKDFYGAAARLMDRAFTAERIEERRRVLGRHYDNITNAKALLRRMAPAAAPHGRPPTV